jgi:hypothetical protein
VSNKAHGVQHVVVARKPEHVAKDERLAGKHRSVKIGKRNKLSARGHEAIGDKDVDMRVKVQKRPKGLKKRTTPGRASWRPSTAWKEL